VFFAALFVPILVEYHQFVTVLPHLLWTSLGAGALGAALVARFSWVFFIFGAWLLWPAPPPATTRDAGLTPLAAGPGTGGHRVWQRTAAPGAGAADPDRR